MAEGKKTVRETNIGTLVGYPIWIRRDFRPMESEYVQELRSEMSTHKRARAGLQPIDPLGAWGPWHSNTYNVPTRPASAPRARSSSSRALALLAKL